MCREILQLYGVTVKREGVKTGMEDQPEFIDINQLVSMLPITRNWVYQRTRTGEIPCYRASRGYVFDRAEVIAWFKEKQRHKGTVYSRRGTISLRQKRTHSSKKINKLNCLNDIPKELVAVDVPKT